ncbi:dihydroneopterin aldolase [Saprospiraceae bacterium]|jgi:dihydroneopterin aldolase|nr:dihydroneopterin aldolase [Bacteroidota bacterium]MDB4727397.1 dihydroneopterin aldolase [Saprospiraceae bacterium]MDF1866172.1 dihydroneopterin aldolase [Saprospiraceae bacterium]
MAVISLEGMEFYAKHGYYDEETIIGGEYIVDVHIKTNVDKAAVSDDLGETVNYETVYLICKAVMKKPAKLIETVANRIALNLKHQFRNMSELSVKVIKKNPPLGGTVASASIEVDGSYTKKCGRCSRPMLCYGDNSCWCMDTLIYQKTLDQMRGHYGNQCLCKQCLEFFQA